jgi:hypothetical protein
LHDQLVQVRVAWKGVLPEPGITRPRSEAAMFDEYVRALILALDCGFVPLRQVHADRN